MLQGEALCAVILHNRPQIALDCTIHEKFNAFNSLGKSGILTHCQSIENLLQPLTLLTSEAQGVSWTCRDCC